MSFTRKHYEAIAAAIRDAGCQESDAYGIGARDARYYIIGRLSNLFKADNPKFDAVTFDKACKAPRAR